MKFYERSLQALLSSVPHGFAAHSRVLARLASLAQIRKLARRLSLCWLNACSVKNKTADLFDYICNCKTDLGEITESWLTTNDAAV